MYSVGLCIGLNFVIVCCVKLLYKNLISCTYAVGNIRISFGFFLHSNFYQQAVYNLSTSRQQLIRGT
jgi:hypothetical protein